MRMIKLKVEWHHTCPDCGTRVVVDYLADANGFRICPWCGRFENNGRTPTDPRFKRDISSQIRKLEDHTNSALTPKH
jgi:hypothetical protein